MSPGTQVLIQLPGAVALLLWGLGMIRDGVGDALGWRLRRFAANARGRLYTSFAIGAGLGASFQSSTAAILLGGSLASAGALSTAQGLALALGADVGATLAAQLFGFNLAAIAPVFIFAGFVVTRCAPRPATRKAALILVGIGLVLISLHLIYEASEPLRAAEVMRAVFKALDSEPLIAVLVFALFAWVCHSSLAAVLMVMSLAAGEVISAQAAIAMTLGANLGAGVIPLTAAGESPEARRIALGNALFRTTGVIAMLPLINSAADTLEALDFAPARAVAHFHTFFNLAVAAAFLMFVPACGKWLEKWWRKAADSDLMQPLYLNMERRPEISRALADATRETLALGDLIRKMMKKSALLISGENPQIINEVKKMEAAVDHRNRHIKSFLTAHLSAREMSEQDQRRADAILASAIELEHIGDVIDHGLLSAAARLHRRQGRLSEEGERELADLYARVAENIHIALDMLMSRDANLAREFVRRKQRLDDAWRRSFTAHLRRLREGNIETIQTSATHLGWVRELKRISGHAAEIADAAMEKSHKPEMLNRRAGD